MNVFMYNSDLRVLELNEPEILLVKEFADLIKRDKTKHHDKAYKELTYIYLAIDWKSPYNQYTEHERHEEALNDSGLTEKEFNDPVFREACRKYRKLQDSSKSILLLNAAKSAADLLIDYFKVIVDLNERDLNGKPIFTAEKFMKEMALIHNVHDELSILEKLVKEELTTVSGTRGGVNEAFDPGEF